MSATARQTTPPRIHAVLYDGHCRFCTQGARRLAAWMKRGTVELIDFQQQGVLERFPGITYEECMERMHLITPAGRIFSGMEAAMRAVSTRRGIGWLAYLYYVPGIRQLLDLLYKIVADNRYRIMGKQVAAGECEGGTCSLHFKK